MNPVHGNCFHLSLLAIQRYDRGMNDADEKRIAAKLARILAMLCVRNTKLEDLQGNRISDMCCGIDEFLQVSGVPCGAF